MIGCVFNNIKPTRSRMTKYFFGVEWQNISSTHCWILNLANPFISDIVWGNCTLNKKVATELGKIWSFTYMYFKKKYCHHSTGKELVFLVNVCSQGGQEYLTETVWTSCHWGSWRTSPCHVPRRGKADVGGVVSPLTHGPCEHTRPEKIKKKTTSEM